MDSWSEIQLKKMQLGGNKKMNDFFKEYGVSKTTDIIAKYNSRAAEVPTLRHQRGLRVGADAPSCTYTHHAPTPRCGY
jgi:hypothetical protein